MELYQSLRLRLYISSITYDILNIAVKVRRLHSQRVIHAYQNTLLPFDLCEKLPEKPKTNIISASAIITIRQKSILASLIRKGVYNSKIKTIWDYAHINYSNTDIWPIPDRENISKP